MSRRAGIMHVVALGAVVGLWPAPLVDMMSVSVDRLVDLARLSKL